MISKTIINNYIINLFFPVGIYLMWKNELWSKKTRWIISSIFMLLIIVNTNKNKSSNISNTQNSSQKITFDEAKIFMQNRCSTLGQTLMKSKTVTFNGRRLYMFTSVAQNGVACISSISEIKLEVIAADCGSPEMKVSEWNA